MTADRYCRAVSADHALPRSGAVPTPARRLDPDHLGDHLDRLYRAAWALCGSREDAEDLVQETYARVLQKPRLLRSDDDLGYLLRVLRNTHFSRLRSAARRPRTDPLPDELDRVVDPSASAPEAALDASELYRMIAELPDPFREALVAIDVVGLSYRKASACSAFQGDDHDPSVPSPAAARAVVREPASRVRRHDRIDVGAPPQPTLPRPRA